MRRRLVLLATASTIALTGAVTAAGPAAAKGPPGHVTQDRSVFAECDGDASLPETSRRNVGGRCLDGGT